MTVEVYVVLSICILALFYLSKSDKKKEESNKRVKRKSADEVTEIYFNALREIDDIYNNFKEEAYLERNKKVQ
jgi:hypothetical protein